MEPSKIVMALKVLQDEGREDLIKEGVIEEAWVGLRRPKRRSAEGVSAAVAACSSPKSGKKFIKKSVEGRKVFRSPDLGAVGGHGVQVIYRQSGRIVGDQSLPVKVRAPSEHRHEGRVRSGPVHPTSREAAGPVEGQPSTSRSAGAGGAALDEELLDYEDEVEVPVMSKKRVVLAGEVPGVVQGGHVPDHRQERSAGSLPKGEEGFVGFLRWHDGGDNSGDLSWANVSTVTRGSREIQNKVDASIQVSAVTETEGKKEVSGGNGDESLEKVESGEGGKSGGANSGGDVASNLSNTRSVILVNACNWEIMRRGVLVHNKYVKDGSYGGSSKSSPNKVRIVCQALK
ncbi:hypothetical protein NDU88_005959 [Pleurodeles waltl]|uniref:Uncharacterized protein n=1 Tax=Pleurodeles waltl TaxID=8319 RepID=A0AAV7PHE0_PLEWA|nr:hypothetical protein NDU88_005959 [Pleurodeles waltl]